MFETITSKIVIASLVFVGLIYFAFDDNAGDQIFQLLKQIP